MSSQGWSDDEESLPPSTPPPSKKRRSEETDSKSKSDSLKDKAWCMYVGRYTKTYSFCKECNDFIYSYKKKYIYDKEIKKWCIVMPSCRKCIEGNIEMSKTYYKWFGGGAKKKESE